MGLLRAFAPKGRIPNLQILFPIPYLDLLVWWLEKNLPQILVFVVILPWQYSSLEGLPPWPLTQHFPFKRCVTSSWEATADTTSKMIFAAKARWDSVLSPGVFRGGGFGSLESWWREDAEGGGMLRVFSAPKKPEYSADLQHFFRKARQLPVYNCIHN